MTIAPAKARILLDCQSDSSWGASLAIHIILDKKTVGVMPAGNSCTFLIDPGTHSLRVKIGWKTSETLSFGVQSNDCVSFRSYLTGGFFKRLTLMRSSSSPMMTHRGTAHSACSNRFGARNVGDKAWYATLNVSPRASFEDIVNAYHRKISEYSYEKIMKMCNSDKEVALRRIEQFNAAFAEAKAQASIETRNRTLT